MKNWKTLGEWLTEPIATIDNADQRRQAQLLAATQLALLIVSIVVLPLWALADPEFPVKGYMEIAIYGTLGITYVVSRTRFYRLSSYFLIALFPSIITAVVITAPLPIAERMLSLNFLVVSLLLSSILLSTYETIFVTLFSLTYVGAFLFVPGIKLSHVYPYWAYLGTTSVLLVVNVAIRSRYVDRLHQSELRYRSLFEQSNDAVFIMDLRGRHMQANQRAADMSGYRPEELIGMSYHDLTEPETHTMIHRVIQSLIQEDKPIPPYECSIRRGDGTPVPVEVNVEVVKDNAGHPLHIQSIVRDITRRKAAQELLRLRRDLTAALSATSDLQESLTQLMDVACQIEGVDTGGIYLLNPETRELNLAMHRGLGSVFVEHFSHFDAGSHPNHLACEGRSIHFHQADTLPESYEQIRQQEGLRAISIIPISHEGRIIGSFNYASHTHNILPGDSVLALEAISAQTAGAIARIQAEVALSESKRDLQTLFDTMDDFVFILDEAGCILQTNPVVLQRLGYCAEQISGASVLMMHPPELRAEAGRVVQSILEGTATYCPLPIQASDGTLIPVETKVMRGQWGNRQVIFGISRDVTERERTAARLRESEVKQFELALERERVQLLRQFIERAAHEFRTPLSIIGSNAFLAARLEDPEKRLAKAAIVQDHITQLSRLVSMLLKMTVLESAPRPASCPVDVSSILATTCQEVVAKYGKSEKIDCKGVVKLPPIMGNADDFAEVLEQLLDNACRFSTSGSTVTVTSGIEDDQVWLEIADNGPGIAEENLPLIFDTFWRLDEAHSTPGFGLGLPIARKIVEMHGGSIGVESTLGVGTTFRVSLPPLS